MKIGDRIKQRRIELGFDADELAKRIGKSRATVYRYENGDIENMPTTVLEPIAKALNTTPAYLMGWSESEELAVRNITKELTKISNRTNLFVELLRTYEKEIIIKQDVIEVFTQNGEVFNFTREDFMTMIQRCHKDITYNFDRLKDEYRKKDDELTVKAAHNDNADDLEEQRLMAEDLKDMEDNW